MCERVRSYVGMCVSVCVCLCVCASVHAIMYVPVCVRGYVRECVHV